MFDKNKTLCFSGHRPEKLPSKGDISSPEIRRLISILDLAIEESIRDGYSAFITGMSRGIDLWAARIVLEKKVRRPELKLICAIPYKDFGKDFKAFDKLDYYSVIESADEVFTLSENYYNGCLKDRNEFMIKNSSKLIAVVSNYVSGTGQTISLAKKHGLEIRVIDLKENKPLFY